MKIIKLIYYNIHYIFANCGIIHLVAQIDVEAGGRLFFDYSWGERYLVRIEYLKRRSNGIECTFDDVENEYLDDWKEKFQEAKRKFDEKKKKRTKRLVDMTKHIYFIIITIIYFISFLIGLLITIVLFRFSKIPKLIKELERITNNLKDFLYGEK